MARPLDGIRVVEITQFIQGPICGVVLGDLGADVIKVEPKIGDPGRGFMRIVGVDAGLKGRNYFFENNNRNKRSVVLDLKTEKGKEIFFKLIATADVFVTNTSLDVPDKLGIGYETLSAQNPRLIYAHASGWGRRGPDARALSLDYTGIARSGLMMMCGERDTPPANILPGMADELGGMVCAQGVLVALYAREKTGRGQRVDTSLMGSLISMEGLILAAPAFLGQEFQRQIRAKVGNPLYNHYKCADGKWIAIAHVQPERYWPTICKVLGIPNLEHDPKFATLEARYENCVELISILDNKFATKTRDEWIEIFEKERLIYTPVQSASEVINDPQALANNYIVWFDHPVFGRTKIVGYPWEFSETPASVKREAPELGQHTEEILLELGYSWDDIVKLKDGEVIC